MDNMNKKHNFLWESEWKEPLDFIEKEDPKLALDLFKAIIKYGTTGELTTLSNYGAQAVLFFIARDIDIDFEIGAVEK